jgi:hypothetical protein
LYKQFPAISTHHRCHYALHVRLVVIVIMQLLLLLRGDNDVVLGWFLALSCAADDDGYDVIVSSFPFSIWRYWMRACMVVVARVVVLWMMILHSCFCSSCSSCVLLVSLALLLFLVLGSSPLLDFQ